MSMVTNIDSKVRRVQGLRENYTGEMTLKYVASQTRVKLVSLQSHTKSPPFTHDNNKIIISPKPETTPVSQITVKWLSDQSHKVTRQYTSVIIKLHGSSNSC